jgi:hypothetical protein
MQHSKVLLLGMAFTSLGEEGAESMVIINGFTLFGKIAIGL